MSEFKQLRIRAYLQTGVISDQFLPLDGILYYHLTRDMMGEKVISKPGESNIREGAKKAAQKTKPGPAIAPSRNGLNIPSKIRPSTSNVST